MKNCEPTLLGCDVRAIATVPRWYLAVTGSSWMVYGGPPVPTWFGSTLGDRPYWPSPPWITKPGTIRWNTTPSYQPHCASATKLPVAMGDRSAVTLITMSPLSVFIVTVRVSPAGSAGGWLVGQPAAAGLADAGAVEGAVEAAVEGAVV